MGTRLERARAAALAGEYRPASVSAVALGAAPTLGKRRALPPCHPLRCCPLSVGSDECCPPSPGADERGRAPALPSGHA